jgi:hypothetical protein
MGGAGGPDTPGMDSTLSPVRRRLMFDNPSASNIVEATAEAASKDRAVLSKSDPNVVVNTLLSFVERVTSGLKSASMAVLANPVLTGLKEQFNFLKLSREALLLQMQLGEFGIIADYALCKELMSVILAYGSGNALAMFSDILRRLRVTRMANTERRKRLFNVLTAIVNMLSAGNFLLTHTDKITKLFEVAK